MPTCKLLSISLKITAKVLAWSGGLDLRQDPETFGEGLSNVPPASRRVRSFAKRNAPPLGEQVTSSLSPDPAGRRGHVHYPPF